MREKIYIDKNDPDLEAARLMMNRLAYLYTDGKEILGSEVVFLFKINELTRARNPDFYFRSFRRLGNYLPILLNTYGKDWKHASIILGALGALIKGDTFNPDAEIQPLDPEIYQYSTPQTYSILIETTTDKAVQMAFFKHYLMALDEAYNFEKLQGIINQLDNSLKEFKAVARLFNKIVYEREFRSIPTISIGKEMYKRDYDRFIKEMSDLNFATQPYFNIYNKYQNKINIRYGLG